ncbi:gibberellin 20-oxidase [Colletotrichum higginsianum]|uniref:Gibberellin 20-oxidase n=1 Tax=Colletotrichum higginsianum (strain IMI 349063) TaxID=759273 RepID=H1VMC5_COLHI|nr:Gibberellin 20-oxidase [Colletotrichum higginsianum IMI 349063]XP_018152840.1 Gibberellin 20-oxidase [Colletotrichum higginsianum IMI 349063]OBR03159.1 Gibberellin 20-oxidase [Colletotrichum higginsianum IMI 349063]OBR04322.1 Gibberellin 20-oxidase [Colletotrichum higginsianum IMI 349063]CCF41378.1 gibberellin 20-oxidase [Colletotrichum higginsianum]
MATTNRLTEKIAEEDAALRVVSLEKLMDGDKSHVEHLLKACTELGFFYLDCRRVASGQVMREVQCTSLQATETVLSRGRKTDLRASWNVVPHFFLLIARLTFQKLFEHPISKIADGASFPGPEVIASRLTLLKQAMSTFREISTLLLERLSNALDLDGKLAYQQYHRKEAVCPTALGLLKYTIADHEPEKVGQIAHTDAGSLSIVFTEVAGLQVLKPNEDQWYYIAPKPGHAVVNVGDALRFISGGLLESSLHRIIPHKDEMGRHKYSIVYLLRPEMDAEFTDTEGVIWKGLEWTNKKHAVFRADAEEQALGTYLTGRDGYVGYWDPEKDKESETISVR